MKNTNIKLYTFRFHHTQNYKYIHKHYRPMPLIYKFLLSLEPAFLVRMLQKKKKYSSSDTFLLLNV